MLSGSDYDLYYNNGDAYITSAGYANTIDNMPGINGITGAELLAVMEHTLCKALEEDIEEAKLRCEEEGEEDTIGEYIAAQAALKRVREFMAKVSGQKFDRGQIQRFSQESQRLQQASRYADRIKYVK